MHNFWLVAKHAYRQMVVRRGFVVITLAVPVGLALLIGIVILVETGRESKLPVGYVDTIGFLDESLQASLDDPEDRIEILAFDSRETAQEALESQQIQAYFVFPQNYMQDLKTELFYFDKTPSGEVWREFDDFVRLNLVHGLSPEVQTRLLEGPDIIVRDLTSNREFSENAFINIVMPIIASILFFFSTMSAAGYLLGAVAGEKENRTMEVMLTSVSPSQFIVGKAVGLMAAALTQLAIYVTAAVVGIAILASYVEALQAITIPWGYLGMMLLFFFPAYVFIAAVMVSIGSAVTELQQAQQVAGIINLFFMAPMFVLGVLLTNPGHPLMTFMTIFPTTSFLTISLRWGLGTIPVWQIAVSWVVLVGSTLFTMWAAARIFRLGMLRYGQPLTAKAITAAVRGR